MGRRRSRTEKLRGGLIVWGLWIGGYFLPLELVAHFWPGCPWPTLSRTFWDLETDWSALQWFVAAFALVLGIHLAFRLTVAALLAVVVALAIGLLVHVLTSKHPWAGITAQSLVYGGHV